MACSASLHMCGLITISPPLTNLQCVYDHLLLAECATKCDWECTYAHAWPCAPKCDCGSMWECVCLQGAFEHFCKNCCCNVSNCYTKLSSLASCMFMCIFNHFPPETTISTPIIVFWEYCNLKTIFRWFLPSQIDCFWIILRNHRFTISDGSKWFITLQNGV